MGHYALTGRLLPLLARGRSRRVVNATCLAYRHASIDFNNLQSAQHYDQLRAYGQSKLAILMFTRELERRSRVYGWDVQSNAAHPGMVRPMQSGHVQGQSHINPSWARHLPFMSQAAPEAALPLLYAATDYAAIGGLHYGPRGVFEFRGAPGPARVSRRAADQALAERLWTVSEQLTNVHYSISALTVR